jgi:hypothetical protein
LTAATISSSRPRIWATVKWSKWSWELTISPSRTRSTKTAGTKIAIGDALLDAGGDRDGEAVEASTGLRRAVGELLQRAQHAGAVRDDVELPEVYALRVATSGAAAHPGLDDEVTDRALAIVFDGLRR